MCVTGNRAQIKTMEEYQRQKFQILEDILSQSANQHTFGPPLQDSILTSSPHPRKAFSTTLRKMARYGQTNEAEYWSPFGRIIVRSNIVGSNSSEFETEKDTVSFKDIHFRPMAWISHQGFSIRSSRIYGRWQYIFRSYRVITTDDPIYAACVSGDLENVKRLCGQGQATPFDTTSDGWSLLHVSTFGSDEVLFCH